MDHKLQAWCWGSLLAACLAACAQQVPVEESPVYLTLPIVNEPELAPPVVVKQYPIKVQVETARPLKEKSPPPRSTDTNESRTPADRPTGNAKRPTDETEANPVKSEVKGVGGVDKSASGPTSKDALSHAGTSSPSNGADKRQTAGKDAPAAVLRWHTLASLPSRQRTTKTLAIFTDAIGCRPCAQLAKSLEHPGVAQLAAGWQFVELTQAEANMLGARLYPTVFRWTGRAWMLIPFPVDLSGVLGFFGGDQ